MIDVTSGPARPNPFRSLSGWAPILLAAAALALVGGYLLTGPHAPNVVVENGVPREDEGAAAHLWQLLMVAQLLTIAAFAALWLPKAPRPAAVMLGLQGLAFVAAASPVFLLGL